jgi:hypothetical protein
LLTVPGGKSTGQSSLISSSGGAAGGLSSGGDKTPSKVKKTTGVSGVTAGSALKKGEMGIGATSSKGAASGSYVGSAASSTLMQ